MNSEFVKSLVAWSSETRQYEKLSLIANLPFSMITPNGAQLLLSNGAHLRYS